MGRRGCDREGTSITTLLCSKIGTPLRLSVGSIWSVGACRWVEVPIHCRPLCWDSVPSDLLAWRAKPQWGGVQSPENQHRIYSLKRQHRSACL